MVGYSLLCVAVNWTIGNKRQNNLNHDITIFIHENAHKNGVWKAVCISDNPNISTHFFQQEDKDKITHDQLVWNNHLVKKIIQFVARCLTDKGNEKIDCRIKDQTYQKLEKFNKWWAMNDDYERI